MSKTGVEELTNYLDKEIPLERPTDRKAQAYLELHKILSQSSAKTEGRQPDETWLHEFAAHAAVAPFFNSEHELEPTDLMSVWLIIKTRTEAMLTAHYRSNSP